MKRLLVLTALCGLALPFTTAKAQSTICGNEVIQQYIDADPVLKAADDIYWINYAKENKQRARAAAKTTYTHANIPIVFHIVLTQAQIDQLGGTAGVYERVATQIEVLNEDFTASNADIANVPGAFTSVIGNAQMNFGVAKKNPSGVSTYGVTFNIKTAGFTGYNPHSASVKRSVSGGSDPWDNSKYINVWVTNISTGGSSGQVLGWGFNKDYAQQNYGDGNLAGVVMHYLTLGRKTSLLQAFYSSNTEKGRTLTHELGHFFNIWHIWGNTPVGNGNCSDDDGIDDTPRQEDANSSCPVPSGTVKPNCTLGSHPGGEMYMNFMDYSGDKCTNMFTAMQVGQMRAQIDPGGPQHELTQHPDLVYWPADVSVVEYNNNVNISPNPSNGQFTIRMATKNNKLDKIVVNNIMGQVVKDITVEDQNINDYNIDLTGMTKGVYMVQMHFDAGVISRKVVIK